MYPKMLQFTPVVQETYPMTLTRNAFLPLVRCVGSSYLCSNSQGFRLLLEEVTKLLSVPDSKSEMIQPWSATLEAFLLNTVRLCRMALWHFSQATCTWNQSSQLGTIWFVLHRAHVPPPHSDRMQGHPQRSVEEQAHLCRNPRCQ
jgi:hypothetical protein